MDLLEFMMEQDIIRVYDGTRYSVLFGAVINMQFTIGLDILSQKSSITYVFSHSHAKVKIDSCDCLPLEKKLTLHNVIILIKSVTATGFEPTTT